MCDYCTGVQTLDIVARRWAEGSRPTLPAFLPSSGSVCSVRPGQSPTASQSLRFCSLSGPASRLALTWPSFTVFQTVVCSEHFLNGVDLHCAYGSPSGVYALSLVARPGCRGTEGEPWALLTVCDTMQIQWLGGCDRLALLTLRGNDSVLLRRSVYVPSWTSPTLFYFPTTLSTSAHWITL